MKVKPVSCPAFLMYDETGKILGVNPVYQTKGAACADIAIPFKTVIPPHTAVKIPLKIAFAIPVGYKIIMYPRSSLLIKKGLMQPVSIIDQDFSGNEVSVPVFNVTDKEVVLEEHERVAQIECVPTYDCEDWEHQNKERGAAGFGTTGEVK